MDVYLFWESFKWQIIFGVLFVALVVFVFVKDKIKFKKAEDVPEQKAPTGFTPPTEKPAIKMPFESRVDMEANLKQMKIDYETLEQQEEDQAKDLEHTREALRIKNEDWETLANKYYGNKG